MMTMADTMADSDAPFLKTVAEEQGPEGVRLDGVAPFHRGELPRLISTTGKRPAWMKGQLSIRRSIERKGSVDQLGANDLGATKRALPAFDDGFAIPSFLWAKVASGVSELPVAYGACAFIYKLTLSEGRHVGVFALKVLKPKLAEDPRECRAFEREVQLISRLKHPHILAAVAVSETPQRAPCVMLEWCALDVSHALGLDSAGSRRRVEAEWPPMDRLRLLTELATALAWLHSGSALGLKVGRVIHRDIKPDNLGVTEERSLRLLDFGLAVVVESVENCAESFELTGSTGSRRYMAPEVALGRPYSTPADTYSFTVTLWECLCLAGKPYAGLSIAEHQLRVVVKNVRPAIPKGWDPELASLVESGWHADPRQRASMATMEGTLKKLIARAKLEGHTLGITPVGNKTSCCC